jgi:TetR/AcrR family transcriptional regulator, transcriptional repressor for nem operon
MPLKDEIIHETIKLFSLKGYDNTGINEIISSVNSSKGGFYNHFASKEKLFYEVLAESQKIWRNRTLYGIDEIISPIGKIIKFLENYKDRYLSDSNNFPGGCIFVALSVELDDQHPDLCKKVNEGFTGVKRMIKRYLDESLAIGEIKEDVDTDQMSEMLFTGMLGASVMFGVDKSSATLEKSIQSLINLLNQQRITPVK